MGKVTLHKFNLTSEKQRKCSFEYNMKLHRVFIYYFKCRFLDYTVIYSFKFEIVEDVANTTNIFETFMYQ